MDYLEQLDKMFDASYRLVTIETDDAHRVIELLSQLSRISNKAYYHSCPGQSMYRFGAPHIAIPRTIEAQDILNHIGVTRHFGVYVLEDFQLALEDRYIVQQVKDIATGDIDKVIVLLSEIIELPSELKPYTLQSSHKMREAI